MHSPLLKNCEQILEILLGMCPKIFSSLITASAYLSQGIELAGSHSQDVVLQKVHVASHTAWPFIIDKISNSCHNFKVHLNVQHQSTTKGIWSSLAD